MKMTSKQFLLLEDSLVCILTSADESKAITIAKKLEKDATTPFYAKKIYVPNYGPERKYQKLYGFYFSSEFDINFFKIKYSRIIL